GHALALIMSLTRKVVWLNQQVKEGSWAFDDATPIHRFSPQTVGLVSYGKIARKLAAHLQAIGFSVIAYDPYVDKANIATDVELVSLEELMKRSDVISLHAPLVKETYQMIHKEMFDLAKPNAVLINTGRGAVVNEDDLIEALQTGKISGAGLDVVEVEPIDEHHPFMTMDQVVLTPHVAFYSEESMQELKRKTAETIISVLKGEKPTYVVNE
ncbi:MAG TPA: C-terminal binding protein, partial [Fodinibius sp.]|nr:C-terminal binding protein [Fodinibius sp.]